MKDPYSILGVSPSATDDEVKRAYRELARKYHPDNYHDNPLADLASEKMKEINEAYETITRSREQGGNYNAGGSAYQYQGGYQQRSTGTGYNSAYAQIRAMINANNLAQAERMLQNMSNRDAEWNYLMGSVYWRKGWMDEAARYFRTAASMEPTNVEYRNAIQYMNQGGQAYRPAGAGTMYSSDAACNTCGNLICLDCCCEMMGGDCIPCC